MRTSKNRQEYVNNIGLIFLEDSEAFIWQTAGKSKILSPILIKDIIPEKNQLILSPRNKTFTNFNQDKDIYFKANRKEMLFKIPQGEYRLNPQEVQLSFPQKVFYREFRETPRLEATSSKILHVEITPLKTGKKEEIYKLNIRNLSSLGAGLASKFEDQESFVKNQLCQVSNLAQTPLARPLTSKVVYNRVVKLHQDKNAFPFFIGLKFEEAIPTSILKDLSTKLSPPSKSG